MKLITAVIRPGKLPQVKEALFKAGVRGITISRVSGHGGPRRYCRAVPREPVRCRVPRKKCNSVLP